MAPRPVEYVIFDMDGLLIDSERVYTEVTNTLFAPYGETLSWKVKAGTQGKPDPDATIFLLSHYPSIPLSAQEFIAKSQVLKDELFKTVQPLPGALNFITHLHKHNIKIAVATSSTRANFEKKASHLSHLFDLFGNKIICADDGYFPKGRGKPCPDIFLAAASLLGAEVGLGEDDVSDIQQEIRQRCVVFEDAVPGVQAGVRAGMGVVWIPDKNILAVSADQPPVGFDEQLESLEDFVPERWGLPQYDS